MVWLLIRNLRICAWPSTAQARRTACPAASPRGSSRCRCISLADPVLEARPCRARVPGQPTDASRSRRASRCPAGSCAPKWVTAIRSRPPRLDDVHRGHATARRRCRAAASAASTGPSPIRTPATSPVKRGAGRPRAGRRRGARRGRACTRRGSRPCARRRCRMRMRSSGTGDDLAPEPVQLVAVDPLWRWRPAATGRSCAARRARAPRPRRRATPAQRAGRAGVVEVDVRQQDRRAARSRRARRAACRCDDSGPGIDDARRRSRSSRSTRGDALVQDVDLTHGRPRCPGSETARRAPRPRARVHRRRASSPLRAQRLEHPLVVVGDRLLGQRLVEDRDALVGVEERQARRGPPRSRARLVVVEQEERREQAPAGRQHARALGGVVRRRRPRAGG